MPTFTTTAPVSATVEVVLGDVRVTLSERDDTVVVVRPSDDSHDQDVKAAAQTRVEYAAGRLVVTSVKQRGLGLFGKPGSVDVTIALPTGSHLQGDASIASFHCVGRLGECRITTSVGDIQLEHTGRLELSTGSGTVRVRAVDGSAVIKNSNGDCWVGDVTGDLRVKAANGDISVDRPHADVTATTANGDVRVGALAAGSASLKTGCGEIEIGVLAGHAARLDVHTSFGRVHNRMSGAERPDPAEDTVDVRAHTSYGDIVIRPAHTPDSTIRTEQG